MLKKNSRHPREMYKIMLFSLQGELRVFFKTSDVWKTVLSIGREQHKENKRANKQTKNNLNFTEILKENIWWDFQKKNPGD